MTRDDPVYGAIIAASAALIDPVKAASCVLGEADEPDAYDPECVRCVALVAVRAAMPHLRPDLTVPDFLPPESGSATWAAYVELHPEDSDE